MQFTADRSISLYFTLFRSITLDTGLAARSPLPPSAANRKIAARSHERQGAVSNGRSNFGAIACDAMRARQIQHATGRAL
jgi:hypothetical protein